MSNESVVRYVGETANKRYPELSVGTMLVNVGKNDIYRVLAPGESFWITNESVLRREYTGEEPQKFGLSFFEVEEVDPLSRASVGPFVHDGRVVCGLDKLPSDKKYNLEPIYSPMRSWFAHSVVCFNSDYYGSAADGLEEHREEIVKTILTVSGKEESNLVDVPDLYFVLN